MDSRRIAEISAFNTLGMCEFELIKFTADNNSLIVRAHRGEPEHFWAELTFAWVGYITCPIYFFDVLLRLANEQEIAQIGPHKNASLLYCFEDKLATMDTKNSSFFISANAIEMMVYYGGESLDELIGRASD